MEQITWVGVRNTKNENSNYIYRVHISVKGDWFVENTGEGVVILGTKDTNTTHFISWYPLTKEVLKAHGF